MMTFGGGIQKDLFKIRLIVQSLPNNYSMMNLISRILVRINNNDSPLDILDMLKKYAEKAITKVDDKNQLQFIQLVMKAFYLNFDKNANVIRL